MAQQKVLTQSVKTPIVRNGKLATVGFCQKFGKNGNRRKTMSKYEFRYIHAEEAEQAADIEQICFPPNEACSREMMKNRIKVAADFFLVAIEKETGKIAGFLNGIATDETVFRDEFFTDAGLHNPKGEAIMILGLDVLPEYRKQGLATEIVNQYFRREQERGRKMVLLTCLDNKVKMYEKMGFRDNGQANSSWGGEAWHEMSCILNH